MKYFVQRNLKHDGKSYSAGDKVELKDEHAAALLKAGAVSEKATPEVKEPEVVEAPQEPVKEEPIVGGKPNNESGEPSLDSDQPKEPDTAKDVTPETDPSENL